MIIVNTSSGVEFSVNMASFSSFATSSGDKEFEQDLNRLSEEELTVLLDKIKAANSLLASENKLIEDVLKESAKFTGPILINGKGGPRKATSSPGSASMTSSGSTAFMTESESYAPSSYRRSRAKSLYAEIQQPTLSIQYKCYIAVKKLKTLKKVLEKLQHSKDIAFNEIKAKLEEIVIQSTEVKKAKEEFNRNIRIEGKHPITKKIVKQKVNIYFEDSLKTKLISTERLRMQTLHDKVMKRKVAQETLEKKKLSENLHEIDFTKIKIEHQKGNEMLREYNQKFLQLKERSNISVQALTDFRKELESEIAQIANIGKQIEWQLRLQKVMESEMSVIHKKNAKLENAKVVVSRDPRHRLCPDVMHYARIKVELAEKIKEVNSWKSKVEYAERVCFLRLTSSK